MSEYEGELYEEMFTMAKTLFAHGSDTEAVEKHLHQKTDDSVMIAVVMKEAKNQYYATLRKEGLAKILIGSALTLLGFAITFFNFHTNRSVDFVLYGFTITGIIIVFWGLFKLIG